MSASIRVGCSGWVYRHWRGIFYPHELTQSRWFEHYAADFATVEINNSFYRLPSEAAFDKWREQAPPGFRYAVKVNRFITHMKKLRDCAEPLGRFITLARRLGGTLGPLLYQLPPQMRRDDDRLASFLALLPTDLEHVFEFRSSDWYAEEVLDLLDRHGVGFVVHDMAGSATPMWASGRTAYVRFHGTSGKYRGRYSDAQLEEWAHWLGEQQRAGRCAWAYFNNDIGGDALEDAQALKHLVAKLTPG